MARSGATVPVVLLGESAAVARCAQMVHDLGPGRQDIVVEVWLRHPTGAVRKIRKLSLVIVHGPGDVDHLKVCTQVR